VPPRTAGASTGDRVADPHPHESAQGTGTTQESPRQDTDLPGAPPADPGVAAPAWTWEPPPPRPPRPRSLLGPLTVSTALVAVGVLALIDALSRLDVPLAGFLAVALGVTGLGLVVGAWFGRARGLIALGVLLALVLVPAEAVDRLGLTRGEIVDAAPTSVAELAGRKEYGAGAVTWDLTGVNWTATRGDGEPPVLAIDQGVGPLVVVLPPDVDVTVDAEVGAGEAAVLDSYSSGLGNDVALVDWGDDGRGGGRLVLDLRVDFGTLEVRRAAA
jgi:hypothetical protein